ncbi:hypothetical protein FRC03_001278 [Tulasnella sp. 419]|nr:hypothetical protein FRC03_001278 [Tulasnella sp. 419]
MSWDSRLLSGLTFLRITAWDGVRPPTEEQYLRVLTSCPNLEELYISGRDDDCREEGLPAVFHTPIPLPRLKTLSLDSLHPTAVRSLLSSIQANPQNLVVLFSYTLTIRWNEVLDMTILFPACRHLLSRFLSSPDTIQFTDDNHGVDVDDEDDTLARFFRATSTSAEGQSSCHLTCGFHNFPFPSVLYPALLPISTYKDIHTLVIGIDTRDLLIRKMLEESVDLKEIRLVSGIKNIWIALQPLAKPLPSSPESPSAAKWLCPRLHKLVIEGTDFDTRGLWKFLELRYGNTGSAGTPTPLSHLHVSRNGAYSGLDKVPLEVASDIAGVVEKGGFVWDSHVFDRDDGKWVAL